MDGPGELQDLVGQLQQLLVLLVFLLDGLPLVVGQDLAFLVGPVKRVIRSAMRFSRLLRRCSACRSSAGLVGMGRGRALMALPS